MDQPSVSQSSQTPDVGGERDGREVEDLRGEMVDVAVVHPGAPVSHQQLCGPEAANLQRFGGVRGEKYGLGLLGGGCWEVACFSHDQACC